MQSSLARSIHRAASAHRGRTADPESDDLHLTLDAIGVPSELAERDHFGAAMFLLDSNDVSMEIPSLRVTLRGTPGAVVLSFPLV